MLLYTENYLQISWMPATMAMVCIVFLKRQTIFSVWVSMMPLVNSLGT